MFIVFSNADGHGLLQFPLYIWQCFKWGTCFCNIQWQGAQRQVRHRHIYPTLGRNVAISESKNWTSLGEFFPIEMTIFRSVLLAEVKQTWWDTPHDLWGYKWPYSGQLYPYPIILCFTRNLLFCWTMDSFESVLGSPEDVLRQKLQAIQKQAYPSKKL